MFRSFPLRFASISSATFYTQPTTSNLFGAMPSRFGPDAAASSPSSGGGSSSSSSSSSSVVVVDHLVVDASSLTSAAIRLLKSEPQLEREASRIVVQEVGALTRRIQPRRSLVLLLDGSEGVWKAAKTRGKGASRKAEERAKRGPGSSLSLAVETALLNSFADRRFAPPEVVVSGSCVPGSIESKAALWAAGAARRPRLPEDDPEMMMMHNNNRASHKRNSKNNKNESSLSSAKPLFAAHTDTVAYFGPNDLYLHLLSSPFSSTGSVSVSQGTTDKKCVFKRTLVDWLGFGRAMTQRSAQLYAMMTAGGSAAGAGSALADSFFQHKRNFPDDVPPPSAATQFQELRSLNEREVEHRMAQEMLFLILLAQGHGGYELSGVPQLASSAGLVELLDSYWSVVATEIKPPQQQQKRAAGDGEGDEESSQEPSSIPTLTDMYKNESWLLERDSTPAGSMGAAAKIFSQLASIPPGHKKMPPEQIDLASCPPPESLDVVPARYGINVDVLRRILLHKSGPQEQQQQQQQQKSSQKRHHEPSTSRQQASQVSQCEGLSSVFSASVIPGKRLTADAAAHLDCVLQIFHLLTLGKAPLPGFFLPPGFVNPSVSNIVQYLRFLSEKSRPIPATLFPLSAEDVEHKKLRELHSGPLTAAEFALLSAGSGRHFSELTNEFVGQTITDSFAKRVAETASVPTALSLVRSLLRFGNASSAHRALCHSPSACLVEVAGKSPEVEELIRVEHLKDQQEKEMNDKLQQQQQSAGGGGGGGGGPPSAPSSSTYGPPTESVRGMMMAAAAQPQRRGAGAKFALMKSHWRMFPVELGS